MTELQQSASDTDRQQASTSPAPRWMVMGVAAYLVFAAVLLFVLLAALVAEPPASGVLTLNIGVGTWTLTPDVRLFALAAVSGALGSFIHASTSLVTYIGNQRIVSSWLPWYLLRPLIGASLAVVLYFVMRAGLLPSTNAINTYGVAAVAALAGMFSKQATDKLDELFTTMFRTTNKTGDAQRADKLDEAAPKIAAVAPPSIVVGASSPKLVISGANFVAEAVVRVNDAPRPTSFDNGRLVVTLTDADVAQAGSLSLVVRNPDGTTSARVSVPVQ